MSQKYLEEMFLSSLPTTLGNRPRQVGCEEEFPVVDRYGHAVDCRQLLFDTLQPHDWEPKYDRVHRQQILAMRNRKSGITITTDAGWGTLEIILPPLTSITECRDLLNQVLDLVIPILATEGWFLLGLGIQPRLTPSPTNWIEHGRHDVIRTTLPKEVDQITLSSASQVSVDVTQSEAIPALNTFRALSGVIHALTANAPLLAGQRSILLAVRGMIWDMIVPPGSYRRHGVGPYFAGWQEYIDYLLQEPLLVVFDPATGKYQRYAQPFGNYLQLVTDQTQRQDALITHQGSIWTDARFKSVGTEQGVIEVRPACQQPQSAKMAVAALVLGIVEQLADVQRLVASYPWNTWTELRIDAIQSGLAARTTSGVKALPLADQLLTIAQNGLRNRDLGEEIFLGPLQSRLQQRQTPAEELLAMFPAVGDLTDQDFLRLVEARRYRAGRKAAGQPVAQEGKVGRTMSVSAGTNQPGTNK